MKQIFTLLVWVFMSQILLGQTTFFGPSYVHTNTGSNCFGDYTILNSSIIGNNPDEIILFTHVYGVAGTHQAYMMKSCGLWHTGSDWSVYDETQQTMDTNYAFNVLNAANNGTGFTHTVTGVSLTENYSKIDNVALNGHPEKIFFITKTWGNGIYDTAHVGIWYDAFDGKWSIYNEGVFPQTLQLNSTYNIFIPNDGPSCFKHVASGTSYITTIDDPRLNGNEYARIFVVHDYTNEAGTTGYVNDELGVWYDGANWTIYTENYTELFVGATFNVMIAGEAIPGIQQGNKETAKLKVVPNPVKGEMGVLLNSNYCKGKTEFTLVSLDGRTMFKRSADIYPGMKLMFDVEELNPGLYFLYARTTQGVISTKVNIVR
jgi:hypothetical protein